jgi:hypothetical protein
MFAPKDQKALFRIGAKVKCSWYGSGVYKVTKKYRDATGLLSYTIENDLETHQFVRQKDLDKV